MINEYTSIPFKVRALQFTVDKIQEFIEFAGEHFISIDMKKYPDSYDHTYVAKTLSMDKTNLIYNISDYIVIDEKGCLCRYNEEEFNKRFTDAGSVSDGYHTFNELYYHRTCLFAMICRSYPDSSWISDLHSDGTMYDGMFIAGIETPEGSYTYHCENVWKVLFENVSVIERAPEYDGHRPEDITRLFSLLPTYIPPQPIPPFEEEEEEDIIEP